MTEASAKAPDEGIAGLHPAYFAVVMAIGIVSIASQLLGIPFVPKTLFALNLLFYPLLWVLTLARAVRHWPRLLADLSHHGRAVGFFTMAAATSVLGSQCIVVA